MHSDHRDEAVGRKFPVNEIYKRLLIIFMKKEVCSVLAFTELGM